jgi:hypothetical protein
MSDSSKRHILCPGCHRPVYANEEGASACIVCGTNFDGSSVPEEDTQDLRSKVRKQGYQPEGLNATSIPAATSYGSDQRSGVERSGDLRLVWEGATHKRNTVAELFPVVLAGLIGFAFFPEASALSRLLVAVAVMGATYLVVLSLVGESLRHYFEVNGNQIVVREGAVWSEVKERVPVHEVEQLYVIRFARGNEADRSRYELRCRLRDGDGVSMCRDLHSLEQALWIEYQLERHLGVIDVPVEGEIGRA